MNMGGLLSIRNGSMGSIWVYGTILEEHEVYWIRFRILRIFINI